MGFFSFLKTSDKALDTASNVVNGAIKGIDALWFTDEEKSRASLQAIELWLKMQAATANENSARSITRRYLAFGFCGVFLFLILLMVGAWNWLPEFSKYILEVLNSIKNIILAIVVFYFGYFGVQQIIGKKK